MGSLGFEVEGAKVVEKGFNEPNIYFLTKFTYKNHFLSSSEIVKKKILCC